MSRDDMIELEGIIVDHIRNVYKVKVMPDGEVATLESAKDSSEGHIVDCHMNNRLRINYIKLVVGDKVTLRVSPYDLTKGTIVYRQK